MRIACATVVLAVFLYGDTQADIIDVFARMAAGLSNDNVPEFMDNIDKNMSGYDTLKNQITALMTGTEITSSVEPIKDEGDETARQVDLDWYLQIRSLYPDGPIAHRRELIHCELRKQGKHWRVVSLKPMGFFAPAKLDK